MADSSRPDILERGGGLGVPVRPAGVLATILAFIVRHALAVFLATLVLVCVSGYLASQLDLITDFAKLIPQDSRSVVEQRRGETFLGNTSLLVVVVQARGAAADQRARQAADEIAAELAKDPELGFVFHRFDRDFFQKNALLYMTVDQLQDLYQRIDERIREEILAENPLFVDLDDDFADDFDDDLGDGEPGGDKGNIAAAESTNRGQHKSAVDSANPARQEPGDEPDIFDPDALRERYFAGNRALDIGEYLVDDAGTTYLVLAQPRKPPVDITYNKRILARVAAHEERLHLRERFGPDLRLDVSGNYQTTTEENESVRADLQKAGLVSVLLLVGVVIFYFRRVRAVWTVFVPLLSGVVVMMGYVKLAVGQLNTITGFCFALFMGLSIDFAIHLLARYDEERARGQTVFAALLVTYRHTGRAAILAALTSAAGFLALTAARFRGFEEFGIIASGGILICLGVIAVQMPALIALSVRIVPETRFAVFRADKGRNRTQLPMTRTIVIAGLGVLVVLGYRATQLGWEDDFRNLRSASTENLEIADHVRDILGRSTQPAVRIAPTLDDAAALARACNREREARGQASTVEMCASLADFIPKDQPAKLAIIARIKALLTDRRIDALDKDQQKNVRTLRDDAPTKPLSERDLPEVVRKNFITETGHRYLMKAYPLVMTWLASNNIRFANELKAGDHVSSADIGPIGTAMIMADLMRIMRRDAYVVVILALVAVLLILLAMYRSLVKVLACYLPLVFSLIATLGAMELMGMRLGLFNMIVLPSLIGLGVDNNIHLLHRYYSEGRGSWPYVLRTTGMACVMAAATTMAGFGGLIATGHLGLRSIGDLALLGILIATLISLVMLPSALCVLERVLRGSGFGVLPGHAFDPLSAQRHEREP